MTSVSTLCVEHNPMGQEVNQQRSLQELHLSPHLLQVTRSGAYCGHQWRDGDVADEEFFGLQCQEIQTTIETTCKDRGSRTLPDGRMHIFSRKGFNDMQHAHGNGHNGSAHNGNGKPSELLLRFVREVDQRNGQKDRELTVMDLRLEVRTERLTEFSDWSDSDLDILESEAAHWGDDTSLAGIVAGTAVRDPQSVSWPHSPSPVAWM
ncbi:MAG: hypothetical protein ACFCD0_26790 [Gemmataceae bacterium]